jgi:hypothetical protein
LAADAKHQLREQANAQATKVADSMRRLSAEFRALSEGRVQEAGSVREYAQQATSKLDQFAGQIDERGFEGLVDDLQRFARRRPGAFLLGAMGAGFLAGRLFRSVRDEQQEQSADTTASAGTTASVGTTAAGLSAPMGGALPSGAPRETSR